MWIFENLTWISSFWSQNFKLIVIEAQKELSAQILLTEASHSKVFNLIWILENLTWISTYFGLFYLGVNHSIVVPVVNVTWLQRIVSH